jgi:hypothetical protein
MIHSRSKRAEILKKVLIEVNSNRYQEYDRYIVFGTTSIWDMVQDISEAPDSREDQSLADGLTSLVSKLKAHGGRVRVGDRATLQPAPKFKAEAFNGLSAEDRRTLDAFMRFCLEQQHTIEKESGTTAAIIEDEIDAALTEEMLGKLAKAVDRATRLEKLRLAVIPNKEVKRYFEEANRCYLYGFNVACVVLCRAILESALVDLCDPEKKLYKKTVRGESYYRALVDKAASDRLLTDDRPEWAIDVRDAGNDAIHNYSKFENEWGGKVEDILLNTRKVLVDLYSSPAR